ncbi:pantothenate kinase [Rhodococcus sp. 27YEA15]|uniref:nucleoside/nucleotide kinase family protein n=1 Tax=Rhodococcus sp. 27YEA15 TaxID=3156259 RepID=UPI003C7AAB2B
MAAGANALPEPVCLAADDLASRVRRLQRPGHRVIIGITGPPGTGKTTLIGEVVEALGTPSRTAAVPMDGFHLSNRVLATLGRSDRKGAVDTFDAWGYAHLLRRLRARDEDVVYAPDFDHNAGDPVAGSIGVEREVDTVFTDGNYLLSPTGAWAQARKCMDEVWYLHTPDDLRLARLVARHIRAGKDPDAAAAWANGPDEVNAKSVALQRGNADLMLLNT